MEDKIKEEMATELVKAYKSLGVYKFYMFGYHAAAWVRMNHLLEKPLNNPFSMLVSYAADVKIHKNCAWKDSV